jgi:Spy/CpxP family protein refolding chaperone
MRKRITLLIAALMLALTMSFGGVAAFAAPADPHPPKEESGPSDGATSPGTCTIEEQKGANVTTTTHKGNCNSNGGQEEVTPSKSPPGSTK